MADVALTMLGNSFATLLTAALAAVRGMEVCLVLAGHEGFDDSFQTRDIFLEGGLLLSDGHNPQGPVVPTLAELGIHVDLLPIDRPTTFVTSLGSVRLGPHFQQLAADLGERFPQDKGALERLARSLQDWYDRWEAGAQARGFADPNPRAWQHETIAELSLTGSYRYSSQLFPGRRLSQLARTSFAAVLDELKLQPAHRQWWDTLLVQRTGHLPLTLDCLTVAQTLGRDQRGLSGIAGGLDPIRLQLLHRIQAQPGCRIVEGQVEHVCFTEGEPVLTQVDGAGRWSSHQVLCDRASLMWQATALPDGRVALTAIPGAQRYPHVVGVLAGLQTPAGLAPASGQTWYVPRPDLPPTASNGFWITHLPPGAALPNPPGIHLATIHGAYLESQLLDPGGRLYPEDDLIRRLWDAAQTQDAGLRWPLEAFLGVVPRRVAPLPEIQTLLPDPRVPVARFMQEGRLGGVPQCWWLSRNQHPLTDLRAEFVLARQTAEQLLQPTPFERVVGEIQQIFAPLQVRELPPLPTAEVPARSVRPQHGLVPVTMTIAATELGVSLATEEMDVPHSSGDARVDVVEDGSTMSAVVAELPEVADAHAEPDESEAVVQSTESWEEPPEDATTTIDQDAGDAEPEDTEGSIH